MNDALPPPAPAANIGLLEIVLKAVPHAHLISDIDVHTNPKELRFTWRGHRYVVQDGLHVDESEPGLLVGSDLAILMERVLRLTHASMRINDLVLPA